ncbi:MAG: NADH-quinone oxidoreductase subunit A [Dehalococcoidia bacterium]|nr:NADH-quinone oxidoreductase subunit A [Dehalococcoidia bacterium]
MLSSFGYVGILAIVGFLFPLGAIITAFVISFFIKVRRPNPRKLTTYECGMEPVGEAWIQFHSRYYLFALLFVVFDVEAVFLYPWAVAYRQLGLFAFVEMTIFVAILVVGYVYAWNKKALEWK